MIGPCPAKVAASVLALALLTGSGCQRGGRPDTPNIVLIVMDTVRADHLSCYGYSRPTTPMVDRFAAEAIRFEHAYSVSSWTLPSHASLFTGLHPATHQANQRNWRLDDRFDTLAELLRARGYSTTAFSENPWVAERTGLAQGFERMEEMWRGRDPEKEMAPHETNRRIADWLRRRSRAKPFFLFINYIEAHYPYAPPPNVRERFVPAGASQADLTAADVRWTSWYLRGRAMSPQAAALRTSLYDAELAVVDAAVGELLSILRQDGSYDGSLIIVTADHGENLGDRGHVDHVFSLYNDTLRVPLLIRLPYGLAGGATRADPVQLTDVFSTIARATRLDPPSLATDGVDLLTTTTDPTRPIVAEYVYPDQAIDAFSPSERGAPALDEFRRELKSLQVGRRKLIWGSDGRHELYELDEAYREGVNIAANASDALTLLNRQLAAIVESRQLDGATPGGGAVAVDAATRERMQALGYMD